MSGERAPKRAADGPSQRSAVIPPAGSKVLVHGLGRFGGGREAIRFLVRRGCHVVVADRSDDESLRGVRRTLGERNIDWQLGREDDALLDGVDLVVTSPAVPDHSRLRQTALARGLPCTQECELFLAAYPGRVVGVTGTNGKSSTATLLHRALVASGQDALLGGNIGHSLLADEASWRTNQTAVLELSSFQLERLDAAEGGFHGAIFTRIGSDHLDRHGSLAAYHAAKAKLCAAVAATAAASSSPHAGESFVVHAADDPVATEWPTPAALRGRFASEPPAPASAGIHNGYVCVRTGTAPAETILHQDALRLLGAFQLENVLATSLAARWLGADAHAIGLAIATAAPLPFRLQLLHVIDGVRIYDNGVSTDAVSTEQALATLAEQERHVHWIGGGVSKDDDHGKVVRAVAAHAASAHVFGTAAEPFANGATAALKTTRHKALDDAFAAALAAARPGDSVLFSPAYASFDQYPNFRVRALEFHRLVRERRTGRSAQR
ncbi:MAG: UDP-N-acetylmuramoyl-L-alanine--D-glutamate ligase [Planctomycetota bacterium]